ncbi:hypothetical protein [Nocardia sp. NBC_00511]|uniref:hypothetical protein n=1 Tax=Nocardia sp. NBC_00511 TaxID=2903591 RepID=UPI0030E18273
MLEIPSAIGYLRTDISRLRQPWDEARIRSLASRLGYDLRKTATFSPRTDRPIHRLRVLISRLDVDAIIIPSLSHFDGVVPSELVQLVDVLTVDPFETYARWAIPPDAPADMGSR